MAGAVRTEKLALGIADVSLGQTSRQIASDEPPALAPNAELSVIGKSIPRIGAAAMVTGAARYTVDVNLPGMLFGRILHSPYPHARICRSTPPPLSDIPKFGLFTSSPTIVALQWASRMLVRLERFRPSAM